MDRELSVLLALWLDGVVAGDVIVRWADRQIERMDAGAFPSWLIELSLHGPVACAKNPSIELPSPAELTFLDRFAVRALFLDLGSTRDVESFVAWAARAAMGEDLDLPEVQLSYRLDHHLNDCDDPDSAVREVRRELPALREKLRGRAERLTLSTVGV